MRAKPARRFQLTGSSTHSAVMVRSRRSVLLKLLVRRNVRRADNARVEVNVPTMDQWFFATLPTAQVAPSLVQFAGPIRAERTPGIKAAANGFTTRRRLSMEGWAQEPEA